MATHTVTTYRSGEVVRKSSRKRFDAFQLQGWQAVYEAASGQGMRDTKAAWMALSQVYHHGRMGLSNIKLGSYLIVLSSE